MTGIPAAEVAPRIDLAVTAVDGVRECYSARPVVARAYERVADVEGSLAAVEQSDGARAITVCIGVSAVDDAAVVASAAATAARGAGGDDVPATVRVRVARLVAPAS
ncbi:hypothetical protein [Microbacterium trichothecenolyticum]|uniref:Asp23/Gls24 family envelope stress response protein n=1 Tax=Microbacterium trichothecenolyticum TaxID=69370 RepID=A0ABU0TY94_MICTR|nr:hypothetical protein [Microbacterium trichothecenolyticum]MDQ1124621.1 hypothetical protein [Microbacterium trichothecenolyticum]